MELSFRPLTDDDLPLLHGWLNESEVVRWWEGDDVSWEAVQRDYGSANPEPVEHWLALADGRPVGWIQCYAVAENDEHDEVRQWLARGVPRTAAGIDYLIGEPADRGRGLGSRMIRAFVDEVVFGRHPGWTQACASPYEANVASWRALRAAGFRHGGDFDDGTGRCRLMVLDRAAGPPAITRGRRSGPPA